MMSCCCGSAKTSNAPSLRTPTASIPTSTPNKNNYCRWLCSKQTFLLTLLILYVLSAICYVLFIMNFSGFNDLHLSKLSDLINFNNLRGSRNRNYTSNDRPIGSIGGLIGESTSPQKREIIYVDVLSSAIRPDLRQNRVGYLNYYPSSSLSSSSSSSTASPSISIDNHHLLTENIYKMSELPQLARKFRIKSSKKLILGMAEDIDDVNFAIYAGSFAKHSNGAHAVIFMSASSLKPKILEIARATPSFFILVFERESLLPKFLRTYHSSSLRWGLYNMFFDSLWVDYRSSRTYTDSKEVSENPTKVNTTLTTTINSSMVTLPKTRDEPQHEDNSDWIHAYFDYIIHLDTRDSLFQDDPFKYCTWTGNQDQGTRKGEASSDAKVFSNNNCDRKLVTLIEGSKGLGECTWNSRWVQGCFSDRIFKAIASSGIHCSGFMIGSAAKMIEYSNIINQILLGESDLTNKFPVCEENGVDQGIHNVIINLGLLDGLVALSEAFEGSHFIGSPAINLQSSDYILESEIDTIKRKHGYIENPWVKNAGYISIIHQYDRNHKYLNILANTYAPWANLTDIDGHMRDDVCKLSYNFKKGGDLFQGVCDVGSQRAMTIKSCCKMCTQKNRNLLDKLTNNLLKYDKNSLLQSTFFTANEKDHILMDNNFSDQNARNQTGFFDRDYFIRNSEVYQLCTGFAYLDGVCFFKSCKEGTNAAKTFSKNEQIISGFAYPIII